MLLKKDHSKHREQWKARKQACLAQPHAQKLLSTGCGASNSRGCVKRPGGEEMDVAVGAMAGQRQQDLSLGAVREEA